MSGVAALAILCVGLFGWGLLAPLSDAVIAIGQVDPIGCTLVAEHLSGGAIAEIHVKNGDFVQGGDVLASIDDKLMQSEKTIFETTLFEQVAARNRLEGVIRANINAHRDIHSSHPIQWDTDLIEAADRSATIHEVMAVYQRLYKAQRHSAEGLRAQLNERILQTNQQIAGIEAQIRAIEHQQRLISRELEMKRGLLNKSAAVLLEPLPLAPGMPVEADIQFGDRMPLNYLLKPFADYFSRSMRQE